ncbi:phosphate ABC transporter substrate-binding/OmpA family protein [Limimaricola sp.]|uniref:phosphate ABC transporter substrate-binding/OmpA family protein n=1 Tax=Limimaricola sp. TaxID=2211665 RepID=UPI004059C7A8
MTPNRSATSPFSSILSGAVLWAALAVAPVIGTAQEPDREVRLTSRSGTLTLSGSLLGYDGRYLRVATEHGELTLPLTGVICEGAACPDPETWVPELRLSGAARMGELVLPALVDGYARERGLALEIAETDDTHRTYSLVSPGDGETRLRVSFRLTSTQDGFADLLADEADLAMAERLLDAEELSLARDAGLGRLDAPGRLQLIGLDALVPVVAPGRPIAALSPSQLARLYSGGISNWSELGGPELPVRLHLGPEASGQMQGFAAMMRALSGEGLSDEVTRHSDNAALAAAVASDPAAIGMLPFGRTGVAQPLALGGSCGLSSHAAPETVVTGDFPITLPLVLYRPMRRLPEGAEAFLGWIATAEAQLVLRRAGVTGLAPLPIPIEVQGRRLAGAVLSAGEDVGLADLQRMLRVLEPRLRLSTTFRFEAGEAALDAVSRSRVVQLAQAIRDGRHDGHSLLLAGFSDGRGGPVANHDLSLERARAVRASVLSLLGGALPPGVTLEVAAFGEAMPMGCDDTETGRSINRRVELWEGPLR